LSRPQYGAEEFLAVEGFPAGRYVEVEGSHLSTVQRHLASGTLDISMIFARPTSIHVDSGAPVVFFGGVHVGCYEVFGADRVHAIRGLKGKSVAVPELGGSDHLFVASPAQ
jgi:NitT/TauT family transport system substrate-binding protein